MTGLLSETGQWDRVQTVLLFILLQQRPVAVHMVFAGGEGHAERYGGYVDSGGVEGVGPGANGGKWDVLGLGGYAKVAYHFYIGAIGAVQLYGLNGSAQIICEVGGGKYRVLDLQLDH